MSEGSEKLPLGKKAIPPLVLSMLLNACSGAVQIESISNEEPVVSITREIPNLTPTTLPTGLYPEETVDLDGNVAITQDEINECSTTNPKITEELTNVRETMDNLVSEMYANMDHIESIEELNPILNRFEAIYGIKIEIPQSEDNFFKDFPNYVLIPNDKDGVRTIMSALESMFDNVRGIPPELVKIANVDNIFLVDEIEDDRLIGRDVTGYYDYTQRMIVLDAGKSYGSEALIHELAHAIDHVLCGETDYLVDEEFSKYNTVSYLGKDFETLDNSFTEITPTRVFSTKYGSTSVLEDRASMIEDLLVRRGVVQPGDPDWGSPYHRKQVILIRRLTEINPNIRDFLIEITDYAKQSGWRLRNPNFTPFIILGQSEIPSTDTKIDLATQEEVNDIEQALLKKIRNRESIPYYLTNEDSFIFIPNQENDSAGVVVFNPMIEPWVDDLMPQHMGTFSWFIRYSDRFQLESFRIGSRPVITLGDDSMVFNESPIQIRNREQTNVPSGFEDNVVMTDSLGNGVGVAIYVDDINSFLEEHGYHY